MFTMHFIGWSDRERGGKTYEELCAEMEASNPDPTKATKALVQDLSVAMKSVEIGATKFKYEELKGANCPKDVQPTHKEQYLTDEDFMTVFKIDKAAFNGMAKWKQSGLKKKVGLF